MSKFFQKLYNLQKLFSNLFLFSEFSLEKLKIFFRITKILQRGIVYFEALPNPGF